MTKVMFGIGVLCWMIGFVLSIVVLVRPYALEYIRYTKTGFALVTAGLVLTAVANVLDQRKGAS